MLIGGELRPISSSLFSIPGKVFGEAGRLHPRSASSLFGISPVDSNPTVIKFGGTSLEDARAIERAARIVRQAEGARPVVVVSAVSGFTDALVSSTRLAADGRVRQGAGLLNEYFERHVRIAQDLLAGESAGVEANIDSAGREISNLLGIIADRPAAPLPLADQVASWGERLSATLFTAVLRANSLPAGLVDARRCIVTNEEHGNATPLLQQTHCRTRDELTPLIKAGRIPVLGGFIGSSLSGATTTLGRGGSDYTAALVGAALSAREIQIWTDVTGVLTADPRIVKNAKTIPRLSFEEAAELAYFGAKVLHPKTVQPVIERGIPISIRNSREPTTAGTVVYSGLNVVPRAVKAIVYKKGITLLRITSARMLGAYGFLRALFEIFDRHQTVVDVVTTSEVSVSLSVDNPANLSAILRDLRSLGAIQIEESRAIICVVGEGLRFTPGIAARVFGSIQDVNITLISQGASSANLTFVIDEACVGEVVTRLHQALFEMPKSSASSAR